MVLLIPLIVVNAIVGGKALLPAVMGFLAVAVVPYCTRSQAAVMVTGLALTGVVSTMAAGTWWAVLVMVLACLAAGAASRLSAGVFGMAPIVASILTLDPPKNPPLVVGIVMLAVGAYVAVVVHLLKFHLTPSPLTWEVAARHAVVQALACGIALAVALYFDLPKGYWLVMTLAIVLRPFRSESLTKNRQRILGTLIGAVLAMMLSPVPKAWHLLLVAVCLTLMFAYAALKNYVLQVTFMTPMIILLVSSGTIVDTWNLDVLRVVYTASACVIGGMLALLLARQDQQVSA